MCFASSLQFHWSGWVPFIQFWVILFLILLSWVRRIIFTLTELSMDPALASRLIPDHIRNDQATSDELNLPSTSSQQPSPSNASSSIPSTSATPAPSDTTEAANFKATSSGNANSSTANAVVASTTGMNWCLSWTSHNFNGKVWMLCVIFMYNIYIHMYIYICILLHLLQTQSTLTLTMTDSSCVCSGPIA